MQLMRLIAVSFLLAVVSIPALASSKNVEYTDAVLVSFKNIDAGISCEADTLQKDKENCYNRSSRSYTLKTQGDGLMVVVFGYNFLNRYNVLANQMPGTHVQIRSDKRGFYVRIGDHEGRYDIVEAQ